MPHEVPDPADLRWLRSLAAALLREPHAADDLVQDTLLASLSAPAPHGVPARRWLAGIARRLAARRLRSEARRTERETCSARPEALPSAADLAARAEAAEWVITSARALPEPFRRTILLRYLEDLSPAEIAAREGRPVDTVRQRVRRGLQLMREGMQARTGRDWSQLEMALLPWALRSAPSPSAAAFEAARAGATPAWTRIGVLTVMHNKTWATAAVCLLILASTALVLTPDAETSERPSDTAVRQSAPADPSASGAATAGAPPARGQDRTALPPVSPETEEPRSEGLDLLGLVTSTEGSPLADAHVVLLEPAGADGERTVRYRTRSDAGGRFRVPGDTWPQAGPSLDLRVHANGHVRQTVSSVTPGREPIHVTLSAGAGLDGVVLDAFGRPVAGVELLAFAAGAGIAHVSPTRIAKRALDRVLGDPEVDPAHCTARTDAGGRVRFTGLAPGPVEILSLTPQWRLEAPATGTADGAAETWLAMPQLGVRVTAVDPAGRPIDAPLRATFRVTLTRADGSTEDHGNWVGGGDGAASFAFEPGLLGDATQSTIVAATFYGTLEARDVRGSWRAPTLSDSTGVFGLAEARAILETGGPDEEQRAEAEADAALRAVLELDVRNREDGRRLDAPLWIGWQLVRPSGAVQRGSTTAPAGTLQRVEVPAGDLQLRVQQRFASGSLPAWEERVFAARDRVTRVQATLEPGGAARIVRPAGMEGAWRVRAQWQPLDAAADDWFGAWAYGTEDDELLLRALRPARWRFTLHHGSHDDAPIVRIVEILPGAALYVDAARNVTRGR